MDAHQFKQHLTDLVLDGREDLAIEELLAVSDASNQKFKDSLLALSDRYNRFVKEKGKGLLTTQSAKIASSKISQALMVLIEQVTEDLDDEKHLTDLRSLFQDIDDISAGAGESLVGTGNKTLRQLAIALPILLVVIVVAMVFNGTFSSSESNTEKSIAVLPFRNISQNENDQYFSDGMTEEIINYLAKAGQLNVISRTSVDQYRDVRDKDIRAIASELNVSHLLEGSVRRSGNTFRISVKLIQGDTGYPLWNDDYDREVTDVLKVQSDISKEVTDVLRIVLSDSERENIQHVQPVTLSAYDFYLQARNEMSNYRIAGRDHGQKNVARAISLFRSAIEADPDFARSYSGLGLAYLYRRLGNVMYVTPSSLDSVKSLADQAIARDSRVDEAYFLLGMYNYQKGNFETTISNYERALEINPNYVEAMLQLGQMLCGQKADYVNGLPLLERAIRLERGPELAANLRSVGGAYFDIGMLDRNLELFQSAMLLDHDSSQYFWLRGHIERVNHRYETGLAYANKAVRLNPADWGFTDQKGWMLEMLGRNQEALDLRLKWFDQNQSTSMTIRVARLYWVLGEKQKAMELFDHMREVAAQSIAVNAPYAASKLVYYDLAGIEAFLGNHTKAYEHLEEVMKMSFYPAWFAALIEIDPLFDGLRNDKEFLAMYTTIRESSQEKKRQIETKLLQGTMKTSI